MLLFEELHMKKSLKNGYFNNADKLNAILCFPPVVSLINYQRSKGPVEVEVHPLITVLLSEENPNT